MAVLGWSRLVAAPVTNDATPTGTGAGILRQGWTIYLIGMMTLFSFVPESAVLDWSALYLSSDHAAGVAVSGMAFALFSACMAVMRFCGDAMRNRMGAVPLLRASGAIAAAGMTLAAFAPATPVALVGFALTGIGLAGIGLANLVPILFSAAGRHGGANPGAAIAVVSFIGYGGMLVVPTVIGIAAENLGFPAVFIALSGLLLAVAALAPAVGQRRITPPKPGPKQDRPDRQLPPDRGAPVHQGFLHVRQFTAAGTHLRSLVATP